MNRIINAHKVFQTNKSVNDNSKVFYCIESNNKYESMGNSSLISLFDLDNNGVLRVGIPNDPFINNMFFKQVNECKFYDKEAMNRISSNGEKAVQIKYLHSFNSIEDILMTGYNGDITKIITDEDLVVKSVSTIAHNISLYYKQDAMCK